MAMPRAIIFSSSTILLEWIEQQVRKSPPSGVDAQKHHRARDLVQDIGEIFGAHDRCGQRHPAMLAEQRLRRGLGEIHGTSAVADRDRKALLDVDRGIAFVRGGNVVDHALQTLMGERARFFGEAADRAFQFGRLPG